MDDNNELQNSEVEVLQSIYAEDFELMASEPEKHVKIKLNDTKIVIEVTLPKDYPSNVESIPKITLSHMEDGSEKTASVEQSLLAELPSMMTGDAVIFTIIQFIQQKWEEENSTPDPLTPTTAASSSGSNNTTNTTSSSYSSSTSALPSAKEPKLVNLHKYCYFDRQTSNIKIYPYVDVSKYTYSASSKKNKLLQRIMAASCTTPTGIYVFGGIHEQKLSNSLLKVTYNLVTLDYDVVNVKANGSVYPPPCAFHSLCRSADTKLLILTGGYYEKSAEEIEEERKEKTIASESKQQFSTEDIVPYGLSSKIYTFNVDTSTWNVVNYSSSSLTAVCCHSSVEHGRFVYTFGGITQITQSGIEFKYKYTNRLVKSSLDSYRATKLGRSKSYPCPRAGAAMERIEGYLFIFGGHDQTNIFNDLWCYNIASSDMTQVVIVGPTPCITMGTMIRSNAAAASYTASSISQKNSSSIATAHSNFSINVQGFNLLVFGGYEKKPNSTLASWSPNLYEFDVDNARWKQHFVRSNSITDVAYSTSTNDPSKPNNVVVMGGVTNTNFSRDIMLIIHRFAGVNSIKAIETQPSLRYYSAETVSAEQQYAITKRMMQFFSRQADNQELFDTIFDFGGSRQLYANYDILRQFERYEKLIQRSAEVRVIYTNPKKTKGKQPAPAASSFFSYYGNQEQQKIEDDDDEDDDMKCTIYHLDMRKLGYSSDDAFYFRAMLEFVYFRSFSMLSSFTEKDIPQLFDMAKKFNITLLQDMLTGNATFETFKEQQVSLLLDEIVSENLLNPVDFYELKSEKKHQQLRGIIEVVCLPLKDLEKQYSIPAKEYDEFINKHAKILKIHKGVLMNSYGALGKIFQSEFSENRHSRTVIDQCSAESLAVLLHYSYTGITPNILPEMAIDLYMLAFQYGFITEWENWLRKVIRENVDKTTCVGVLNIADLFDDETLKNFMSHWISKRYGEIFSVPRVSMTPQEVVKQQQLAQVNTALFEETSPVLKGKILELTTKLAQDKKVKYSERKQKK